MPTINTTKLVEIFIECDDFINEFENYSSPNMIGTIKRKENVSTLSCSEVITILIFYHLCPLKCFKYYYEFIIKNLLSSYFPNAPSYSRFISLQQQYILEIYCFTFFLTSKNKIGQANYIDSKRLEVCHIKREKSHKVMDFFAQKGKSSTGWFYGLKIHIIVNEFGEICRFLVTSGNKSDNNEHVLRYLFNDIKGTFYGDKGYITTLKDELINAGVKLITKLRKNMKKKYKPSPLEKENLKKRGIVETVFGLLKFQCNLEHSRHRSPVNFFINLFSSVTAYSYYDNKPSAKLWNKGIVEKEEFVLI